MQIQEIIANALDLSGGEIIKQKLDSNYAVLCAMNVIDTMMMEAANSNKQIPGYKIEINVSAGTTTGTVDASTLALDTKYVRWRRQTTDRWEVLDIVDNIEELTDRENEGRQAICFEGKRSPLTYLLSWAPDEAITLELWGRSLGLREATHATGLMTFQGRDKSKGFLTVQDPDLAQANGFLTILRPSGFSVGTLTFRQPRAASGLLTFVGTPTTGETLDVNGLGFTFREAVGIGGDLDTPIYSHEVRFTSSPTYNASALAAAINAASGTVQLQNVTATASGPNVTITFNFYGTAGNSFTLSNSSGSHVTRGATTLTGGVDNIQDGEFMFVNGVSVSWVVRQDLNDESDSTDIAASIADYVDEMAGDSKETATIILPVFTDINRNILGLANALAASTDSRLRVAEYEYSPAGRQVIISYRTAGYIGNSFEINNSSSNAVGASGSHLSGGIGGIVERETIVINGVTWTFSNVLQGTNIITFTSSATQNAVLIAAALNASSNGSINVATYSTAPFVVDIPIPGNGTVYIRYDAPGPSGNGFTLAISSNGNITRSGATLTGGLTGGVADGEELLVNGKSITFRDTPVGPDEVQLDEDNDVIAQNLSDFLNQHADPRIAAATYTFVHNQVYITHKTSGLAAGLAFDLFDSSSGAIVRFAAHLTTGILEGDTMTTNGQQFMFTNMYVADNSIPFETSFANTTANIAAALAAHPATSVVNYEVDNIYISMTYAESGAIGNSFTMDNSTDFCVAVSGPVLSGGFDGIEQGVVDTELADLTARPPFAPEFSLLAAYRIADFVLNQLLLMDARKYQPFVNAQKGSISTEHRRLEHLWTVHRFYPSDANAETRTDAYDPMLHDVGDVIDDGSHYY